MNWQEKIKFDWKNDRDEDGTVVGIIYTFELNNAKYQGAVYSLLNIDEKIQIAKQQIEKKFNITLEGE